MAGRSCYQISAAVLMVCFLIAAPAHAQHVLYVDAEAPGPTHDGSSWSEAFLYLQDALATAASLGDEAVEIRVAQGIYTPDRDTANPKGTGDREATFQLLDGVAFLGGYRGCPGGDCAGDPDQRDIKRYETVLSGDLNGDDALPRPEVVSECCQPRESPGCGNSECEAVICALFPACCEVEWYQHCASRAVAYCCELCSNRNNCENSYHVVDGVDLEDSATLDGLVIADGNANGYSTEADHGIGGGLHGCASSTISDCVFRYNSAVNGGGMFSQAPFRAPVLRRCNFLGNWSATVGGGLSLFGDPTLTDCMFSENEARQGGGVMIYSGLVSFTDCIFEGNEARNQGGAINNQGSLTLEHCRLERNHSQAIGGGIHTTTSDGSLTVTNSTINRNTATSFGGGITVGNGQVAVSNSTLTGNTAYYGGVLGMWSGTFVAQDCLIAGNSAGLGGALYVQRGTLRAENCLLVGNSAGSGAAAYGYDDSNLVLANCSFGENSAPDGRAVACDSYQQQSPSTIEITNSVLRDGADEISNRDGSTIMVTYSDIQDDDLNDGVVYPGTGNIDDDPLFVPGPGGCYYLSQVAAGDAQQSPCVDAGSDTAANYGLDAMTTRSDEATDAGIVDMGYHYPVTGAPLVMGDYDRSGRVDLRDFAALQCCFTSVGPTDVTPCCRIFDFTPDADVDLGDAAEFRSAMNGP